MHSIVPPSIQEISGNLLQNPPLVSANRSELDIRLQVKSGQIPADLSGYVFINSAVGSVNSGGLPYPLKTPDGKHNPEAGSPVINGDGMLYRFDLTIPGEISLKTRLMKTPCYYADQATQYGTPLHNRYGFRNMGLSRISSRLGLRNQLNTAVVPVKFHKDAAPRLIATYDAGRPYEIDANTLRIKTPIGKTSQWQASVPSFLQFPFPIIQSTAHPAFDPLTQEFFSVNYTKSSRTMFASVKLLDLLARDEKGTEKEIEAHLEQFGHLRDKAKMVEIINLFFRSLDVHLRRKGNRRSRLLHWMLSPLQNSAARKKRWQKRILSVMIRQMRFFIRHNPHVDDAVFLVCWKGDRKLHKWKVTDEQGKDLTIQQCIHQVGVSQDYFILADTSFNSSIDILVNNPFPNNHKIDRFIRDLTSVPMQPFTPLYLIKRSDLTEGKDRVKAKTLRLPLETVHFSVNYANPGGQITLFTAHNSAACIAEWIRLYDTSAFTGKAVAPEVVGLLAMGCMDMGRIGRFVIDGPQGVIAEQNILHQKGKPGGKDGAAHTWGIGLYTYRNMNSAETVTENIRHMYWQSWGLDQRFLTSFIHHLYQNYPNRLVPADEVMQYTHEGMPAVLYRVDTLSMTIEDHYAFPEGYAFRSVEFIPRRQQNSGIDPQMDGYLICTLINEKKTTANPGSEIWLFDAAALYRGAICILTHPWLNFALTLHSVWMEKADSQQTDYHISIREDYEEFFRNHHIIRDRKEMKHLFDHYIYPHFSVGSINSGGCLSR